MPRITPSTRQAIANSSSSYLIIGVGNAFRHDDAAGLLVARQLKPLLPDCALVSEQSGDGAALMAAWQGSSWAILVDAVSSGSQPGTVLRFNAHEAPLPASLFSGLSSHSFGVNEAIEMGRSLDQLPDRLVLFGIEGESFGPGVGITPAVGRAVEIVIESVLSEVNNELKRAPG